MVLKRGTVNQEHPSRRRSCRDREPHRQGQGPSPAYGIPEEGVSVDARSRGRAIGWPQRRQCSRVSQMPVDNSAVRHAAELEADRDDQQRAAAIGEVFRVVAEHLRGRADLHRPIRPHADFLGRLPEQQRRATQQDRQ